MKSVDRDGPKLRIWISSSIVALLSPIAVSFTVILTIDKASATPSSVATTSAGVDTAARYGDIYADPSESSQVLAAAVEYDLLGGLLGMVRETVSAKIPRLRTGRSALWWRRRFLSLVSVYVVSLACYYLIALITRDSPHVVVAGLLLVVSGALFLMVIAAGLAMWLSRRRERRAGYVTDPLVLFGRGKIWQYWLLDDQSGEVIRPPRDPTLWESLDDK